MLHIVEVIYVVFLRVVVRDVVLFAVVTVRVVGCAGVVVGFLGVELTVTGIIMGIVLAVVDILGFTVMISGFFVVGIEVVDGFIVKVGVVVVWVAVWGVIQFA